MKKVSLFILCLMMVGSPAFSQKKNGQGKLAPRDVIERIVGEKDPELKVKLLLEFLSLARNTTIQHKANIPYKVLLLDKQGIEMDHSSVGEHLADVATIVILPGNEKFKFPSFVIRDVNAELVMAALAE